MALRRFPRVGYRTSVIRPGLSLSRTQTQMDLVILLVRSKKWSSLCAWGMNVAKRRGMASPRRGSPQTRRHPASHAG